MYKNSPVTLSKCIKNTKILQNNKKQPKNHPKSFDKNSCVKYNEGKNFR